MCTHCRSEVNVELTGQTGYQNPHYECEWEVKWHSYYPVRHIYPELLKQMWDTDGTLQDCPVCRTFSRLIILYGSLFDVKLLKNSFKFTDQYICKRCDQSFISHKCVLQVGEEYVCADCAVFE